MNSAASDGSGRPCLAKNRSTSLQSSRPKIGLRRLTRGWRTWSGQSCRHFVGIRRIELHMPALARAGILFRLIHNLARALPFARLHPAFAPLRFPEGHLTTSLNRWPARPLGEPSCRFRRPRLRRPCPRRPAFRIWNGFLRFPRRSGVRFLQRNFEPC